MDECKYLIREKEIVEDELDPSVEIHYPLFECVLYPEFQCPYPAVMCAFKDQSVDPSVSGEGMDFKDKSILQNIKDLLG